MDYVTRQLTNLADKFRKEISKLTDTIRSDLQQQIQALHQARNAYEQGRNTPPILRAELQIPHPIEVQTDPKNKKTGREWYKLGIETLTLIAVLGYFIVTNRMYHEMIAARHVSQNAIVSAKQSVDETIRQTREQFRQDARPYVWLTATGMGQPEYIPSKPPADPSMGQVVWSYHYTDFGKTPAYGLVSVERSIRLGGEKAPYRSSYKFYPGISPNGPPIPPGKDDFNTAVSDPGITPKRFSELLNIDRGIAIKIRMQYTDSYGIQYETGICFHHLTSGAIQYCEKGNYIK